MPTAEDSCLAGERSQQPVASTLTFQLLTISNPFRLVKGLDVKNLSVSHSYSVVFS